MSHSESPCVATTSTLVLFACAFWEGVAQSVLCQDVFVFAFRAVWRSMPAMLKSEPLVFGETKDETLLSEVTNSLVYLFLAAAGCALKQEIGQVNAVPLDISVSRSEG